MHNKYNFRHDDFEWIIEIGNVQNRDAADIWVERMGKQCL